MIWIWIEVRFSAIYNGLLRVRKTGRVLEWKATAATLLVTKDVLFIFVNILMNIGRGYRMYWLRWCAHNKIFSARSLSSSWHGAGREMLLTVQQTGVHRPLQNNPVVIFDHKIPGCSFVHLRLQLLPFWLQQHLVSSMRDSHRHLQVHHHTSARLLILFGIARNLLER